jgi:hypothetical protein
MLLSENNFQTLIIVLCSFLFYKFVIQKFIKLKEDIECAVKTTQELSKAQQSLDELRKTIVEASEQAKKEMKTYTILSLCVGLGAGAGSMYAYMKRDTDNFATNAKNQKNRQANTSDSNDMANILEPILESTIKVLEEKDDTIDKKAMVCDLLKNVVNKMKTNTASHANGSYMQTERPWENPGYSNYTNYRTTQQNPIMFSNKNWENKSTTSESSISTINSTPATRTSRSSSITSTSSSDDEKHDQ